MARSLFARSFATVVLFLTAASASAQTTTYTWNGGSTCESRWFTTENWSAVGPAGPPPLSSLTNTVVILAGNSRTTNALDYSFSTNSLTFAAGAGAFTVNNVAPPDGPTTLTI